MTHPQTTTTPTQKIRPGDTTHVQTKPKTTKPRLRKPLTPQQLLDHETKLLTKYPHIIKGTLLNATKGIQTNKLTPAETAKYKHKRSITIQCTTTLKTDQPTQCTNTRRIATSDLAQVKRCKNCTKNHRNARKRARRALTKAQQNN